MFPLTRRHRPSVALSRHRCANDETPASNWKLNSTLSNANSARFRRNYRHQIWISRIHRKRCLFNGRSAKIFRLKKANKIIKVIRTDQEEQRLLDEAFDYRLIRDSARWRSCFCSDESRRNIIIVGNYRLA